MTLKLLTEHILEFISLKGGCTAPPESTHVKMPHCWKSHVMAHIMSTPAYISRRLAVCFTILSASPKISSSVNNFFLNTCKSYVIVIPWAVRLYAEIIHELQRVDYLKYRWTNMV